MATYFCENSDAMVQLESMVDAAGIRNVLYALADICNAKEEHLAHAWQDMATARVWRQWARRCDHAASGARRLVDPLEPIQQRQEDSRLANHIDGYDRDDLGESPDY